MSSPDYAILTEHFGFPPIALIDDVINAVNLIMYRCTDGMEKYLLGRQEKRKQELLKTKDLDEDVLMEDVTLNDQNGEHVPSKDEIKLGTAKLETLLETEISKNFDKFELYCLRNLFSIPKELIDSGMFRLSHHKGIDFDKTAKRKSNPTAALDAQIESLLKDIQFELQLRKILKLQIVKAKKLVGLLEQYKGIFKFLKTPENPATADLLKALSPLDENLFYLLEQANELFAMVQKIQFKLGNRVEVGGIKDLKLYPSARAKYLNGKSYKLLESIGVLENENREELLEVIHGEIRAESSSSIAKDPILVADEEDLENAKLVNTEIRNVEERIEETMQGIEDDILILESE